MHGYKAEGLEGCIRRREHKTKARQCSRSVVDAPRHFSNTYKMPSTGVVSAVLFLVVISACNGKSKMILLVACVFT